MAITKEQLLATPNLRTEEVEVEGLGTVRFRELSTADRLAFVDEREPEEEGKERPRGEGMRTSLRFVARSLANGDGRMFADDELDGAVEAMMERPLDEVQALITACFELNRIGQAAVEEEVGN